jgi:alpha-N-acetylglucosaminidase
MLERVIGTSAAAQISLTLQPPVTGADGHPIEEFTIEGGPGNIVIQATTPSALTQGAGWYLKYVARADLMLRGVSPVLPSQLPAPGATIRRIASVPHRYAFNDTNDGYTDPYLPWAGWENQLDLMALHGINEVYITVGTDAVFYQLMQRYGYAEDEVRQWIPDPAHQPWWVLQNMAGGDFPISQALLGRRAEMGRRIADRARELGITPVFPGYWGTVPTDFATRNAGADVIPQGTWVGYERPAWLNPTTPLFQRIAADYYALSAQILGPSTMYKLDPMHEGGQLGHVRLGEAATAIETALQAARPGATWAILAWEGNPSNVLLAGIADKSRVLLLASEADRYATWDSAQRWPDVPYALGSIYNYGGRNILGANARATVERWFADRQGPNAGRLRGVALFSEAWTANPAAAELLSELPWHDTPFLLEDWLQSYAASRYGTTDPHAATAWRILADTVYATRAEGVVEAQESLFNAQPSLTAKTAMCCTVDHMRYSGPDVERAWRELRAAAPAVTQSAAYAFDLADVTRQVIANRARVLLPLIRNAYETANKPMFDALTERWLRLMDLADQVQGTHPAFMLGAHLGHARAIAATPDEQAQLVQTAVNLVTNWGIEAGFYSGLRDYANRDWNCLTATYYKPRWTMFFDGLRQQLAGGTAPAIDWYQVGVAYARADHSACASVPAGNIVQIADTVDAVLAVGPDASRVPEGWRSYTENDATFGNDSTSFTISSAGADLWQNVNQFGVLYQPGGLRDGGSATVRVASLQSPRNRPWARAGLMVANDVVARRPGGFANIAVTPANGCVFSWAADAAQGLREYTAAAAPGGATWLRMSRIGNVYVGACSSDGVHWTVVGSAVAAGVADVADVGMFVIAANAGAADRATATFDHWLLVPGAGAVGGSGQQIAIEFVHAAFGHHFISADPAEVAKLDTGVFSGWARTGLAFNVHGKAAAGRASVCRFFTTAFPPTSSHFYAPRGLGCEGALDNGDWQFEGDVFFTALPDADGHCPGDEQPVYRLYNNGQGGAPNHRFTTDASVRAQMLASGYIAEGTGIGVGMCSPR